MAKANVRLRVQLLVQNIVALALEQEILTGGQTS